MRRWDDKDANGNKLTDGRVCLVITSDSDPDLPEQRIYGKDKDEIIDKAANTIATGQSTIHRLRKNTPAASAARPAAPAPATPAAGSDLVLAVADLANPAKAPGAVKTLLAAAGVDVNRQAREDAARRIADVAEQWERQHPDYPKDPRNDQILMNKAALLAGGALRITVDHIDAAYEELTRREMFFEPKPAQPGDGSTVQPGGSSDSRTVRNATSYRRNTLRSSEPNPATPSKESEKEARWRTILEKGTGQALEDAIRNEPGFAEWVDKQYAKKTA